MKNIAYYHLYMTDNPVIWSCIFCEQIMYMERSSLLNNLDEIRIVVISKTDRRISKFIEMCKYLIPEEKVKFLFFENPYSNDQEMLSNLESNKTISENHTMRLIYNDAQTENCNLLYIHSKGIKPYLTYDNMEIFVRYHHWRQYLNWGVLTNWKECIEKLNDYDIVGINYRKDPSPHFSGNFWWSKSSYIKTLPDPSTKLWWQKIKFETTDTWLKNVSDRFRDEMWPCSINPKVYNIHEMTENPAAKIIKYERYGNEHS